ncbi:MAG TPA: DNA polymerase III subunit delta [Holophaga sp.]|nr:DNA polymerase III subunit delta [Holophaga sp.]HQL47668.1 DNA polymerase III subunit delta [Holophaga sp.]
MSAPGTWLAAPYALVHGDDSDGRRAAVEAWKARHVDPEWEDFSLTVCAEGCPWPEVRNALSECAPLGAVRVVVVPQAENLLEKPKELPAAVRDLLVNPLPDTRLLLVSRTPLSAGPGRILGAKPFSEWAKEGRVLKVGALDEKEAPGFVESTARAMGLSLEGGVAARLVSRLGGNPGVLRRALEVLELMTEGRRITAEDVDQATFRMGEQGAFAWSQAWQKGNLAQALVALRQALEDHPVEGPLMLLSQARREVDRVCRLAEARAAGLKGPALTEALGLSPRQAFLVDGYSRVLDRHGAGGAARLLHRVNQADLDLKGVALSGSPAALVSLTLSLARAWAG